MTRHCRLVTQAAWQAACVASKLRVACVASKLREACVASKLREACVTSKLREACVTSSRLGALGGGLEGHLQAVLTASCRCRPCSRQASSLISAEPSGWRLAYGPEKLHKAYSSTHLLGPRTRRRREKRVTLFPGRTRGKGTSKPS